jgi:2Fe-2S ferredoxin
MPAATDDEEDQLDNARGLKPTSRLACQAVPDGSKDVVVEIPTWNRNLVAEDHH